MRYPFPVLALIVASAIAVVASEPVPLFNGKDLSGWWGRKTKDPQELLDMSGDDLAKLKESSLADIHAHWSVAPGGVLVAGSVV